jgi:6-phosphogluconolactonase
MSWKSQIKLFDERRDIIIPGDTKATVQFCAQQFLAIAKESIERHGFFSVALSGGSTPKPVYELISRSTDNGVDWSNVKLFWSDERCVPPTDKDSNYHMTMQAGFDKLPLKKENIHRMQAEKDLEKASLEYEEIMRSQLHKGRFDLIILGMGEDGHTASLFPFTHGLHATGRQVIGNFVPKLNTWRMTLTYEAINAGRHIAFYIMGSGKADTLLQVITGPYDPDKYPSQKIGTSNSKALWILDDGASQDIRKVFT